jgi:hypothetical protein
VKEEYEIASETVSLVVTYNQSLFTSAAPLTFKPQPSLLAVLAKESE